MRYSSTCQSSLRLGDSVPYSHFPAVSLNQLKIPPAGDSSEKVELISKPEKTNWRSKTLAGTAISE